MNNTSLVGQIDLLALAGARFENGNVIVPATNPSVFVFDTKSGQKKAYLDIVVRESSSNQYGNTHFVKTSVGKTNRERLGLDREGVQQCCTIIGNLKPYESQKAQEQQAPIRLEPEDDLPEGGFQGF